MIKGLKNQLLAKLTHPLPAYKIYLVCFYNKKAITDDCYGFIVLRSYVTPLVEKDHYHMNFDL